jgi:hypothetical protein
MNPSVAKIFTNLRAGEASIQERAVVEMMMFLEITTQRPEADEQLCATFLTEDQRKLRLSPSELEEVFDQALDVLKESMPCRETKISLFWVITKLGNLSHGERLLQFFSDHAQTFDEQEAFSSIALLRMFLGEADKHRSQLRTLVTRHNFTGLLQSYQANRSQRLRESAAKFQKYLESLK